MMLARADRAYLRQTETLRWSGHGWALRQRHRLLVCEMNLRGYPHSTPVLTRSLAGKWPDGFIETPAEQLRRHGSNNGGRIPLPTSVQRLWGQHKYSILARSPALYSTLGRKLATNARGFDEIAMLLVEQLRLAPSAGGIRNALQHMWGYVNDGRLGQRGNTAAWSAARLLREIQQRAVAAQTDYLLSSTALTELMAWL